MFNPLDEIKKLKKQENRERNGQENGIEMFEKRLEDSCSGYIDVSRRE